jgi:hypothetical protein
MAMARDVSINLARTAKNKRSVKLRRKLAGGDPKYVAALLTQSGR